MEEELVKAFQIDVIFYSLEELHPEHDLKQQLHEDVDRELVRDAFLAPDVLSSVSGSDYGHSKILESVVLIWSGADTNLDWKQ